MTQHLLLLARTVDHAGFSLLVSTHPNPLPPEAGSEAVDIDCAELYQTLGNVGYGASATCLMGSAVLCWLGLRAGRTVVAPATHAAPAA